jgi:hypothetical protein
MGRRLTTPQGAKAVSAKLPPCLQIGLHQLILDRWRATGVKPSQNQLLIAALREYLEKEGVNVSQIDDDVEKWKPKRERGATITNFPKKRKTG